jgi:LuxR family maltose regulon positive regulatory protein
MPVLATKLHIPAPRPSAIPRPRLVARLDAGLHRRLTLLSASAGFGKSTLVSEWLPTCGRPAAWLSLDEGDNDPVRFLMYLVAAMQTIVEDFGTGVMALLQSPLPPSLEGVLTALINELTTLPIEGLLVLDDYHVIDAPPVDQLLAFLLENLPPQLHLVIATREDPNLPLARLRVRDQLTELRAEDLRFTRAEAAGFLNQAMGLDLSQEAVAQLETRTEGWIAGLQLAALSMQGHQDPAGFIASFTGSHRFVLDYLVEEVLQRQPERVQTFLLGTALLDRMCASLCEAVLGREGGQETLNFLERANLFIVPLDDERRWYRYHHLFAELLRQRLLQSAPKSGSEGSVAAYHRRASLWFEENGMELDAFRHAAAAHDLPRATRLVEGAGMPLHFRGAVAPVLSWLATLPAEDLDASPSLWVMYASALLFVGQMTGVEPKLQAAEAALEGAMEGAPPDARIRDLIGHIASIRATLAITRHEAETILHQSQRALEYLHPANLPVRTATAWTLGHAYQLQGDRVAARRAYTEALAQSEAIGHIVITLAASIGLGSLDEQEHKLDQAAQTYRRVLDLAGESPLPVVCQAHLGLAQISLAWNDLDAAERHARQGAQLAKQLENTDRLSACEEVVAQVLRARESAAVLEPLSARELEILRLIARGHSNREIGEQLFLALDTVKGYNRSLFDKLHVQRRTEAVARARELKIL